MAGARSCCWPPWRATARATTTGIGLAVFGLGFGMVGQVLTVAVQNGVDRRAARRGDGRRRGSSAASAARSAPPSSAPCSPRRRAAARPPRADVIDGVQAVFLVAAPLAGARPARRLLLPRDAARRPPHSTPAEPARATVMPPTSPRPLASRADGAGVIEVAVPPGWDGPPLHHHDFDETFYVLEGELTFQLGDEIVTRGAGALRLRPARQRPHAREPLRRARPLPARLHAGRVRAALRPASHRRAADDHGRPDAHVGLIRPPGGS